MDDVIYEREVDVVYGSTELSGALYRRDRAEWRLVAVHSIGDESSVVWERALSRHAAALESSARARIREYHGDARTYQCDNCNGTGRALQMDDSKDRCSPCNGTGRVVHEDTAQASPLDSVLTKLREMQATGRRDLQASGDRREWENSSTLETELRVVDAIIAMIEGVRAEVSE